MIRRTLLLASAITISGCASTIESQQIKPDLAAGTAVDGIPFRIRDRLTMELYRKTDKGYVLVNSQQATMADPGTLYVLNFTGQMLADTSVKFEQLSDGSLSTVKLTGTPRATEAVTAASAGVDTLVATDAAIKAAKKAEADQDKAATAAAVAVVDAAASQNVSATELVFAARVLELQLAELPADAKPSQRTLLEGQVAAAKLKARSAAAKAGLDDPFP